MDKSLLTVYEIKDGVKKRLGSPHDGGYIVLEQKEYDLLIGAGVCDDDTFERQFLDDHPQTTCLAFDGTISQFPSVHDRITWVPKNIGGENTENVTNLHNEIEGYSDVFVKMDIEGAEYEWFRSLTKKHLNKFKQIVLETHGLSHPENMESLLEVFETHYLIHIHGNNHLGHDTVTCSDGSRLAIPQAFEFTFVRKSDFKEDEVCLNTQHFPMELDTPNASARADFIFTDAPWVHL